MRNKKSVCGSKMVLAEKYLLIFLAVFGICRISFGIDFVGTSGIRTGNWSVATSWFPVTEPTSSDYANAPYDGTVITITEAGEVAKNIWLSNAAFSPRHAEISMESGDLTVADNIIIPYSAGNTATFKQTGGDVVISDNCYIGYAFDSANGVYTQQAGTVSIGDWLSFATHTNSIGIYYLNGGSLDVDGWIFLPNKGRGTFNQSGGAFTHNSDMYMGYASTGRGEYNFSGGMYYMNGPMYISYSSGSIADFNQSGGTNQISGGNDITIARLAGCTGTYSLVEGSIDITTAGTSIHIGVGGNGTLKMGQVDGNGANITDSGTASSEIRVSVNSSSVGIIQGWGTIDVNKITLNGYGKVIADGYGQERTLDLLSNTLATVANSSDSGWYAQNGGKLILPPVDISNTFNMWGQSLNHGMVNHVNFPSSSSGVVTGALLAVDHADISLGDIKAVSVWDFTPPTSLSGTVIFRYDDASAASQGLDEDDLLIYQSANGSTWTDVTGSLNTNANTITTISLSALGKFAVGKNSPPLGTTIVIK